LVGFVFTSLITHLSNSILCILYQNLTKFFFFSFGLLVNFLFIIDFLLSSVYTNAKIVQFNNLNR